MPSYYKSPDLTSRMISAACYLTAGIAGLIYIIMGGRDREALFFRFHFLQAILLTMIIMLCTWGLGFMTQIVGGILGLISPAIAGSAVGILAMAASALQIIMYIGCLVGLVQALRGRYIDLPVVSKLVRQNLH
jgi:uncharacterized membrane protein